MELRGSELGQRNSGIPLQLPRHVRRRVGDLPFEWLRQIARKSGKMRRPPVSDDDSPLSGSEDDSDGGTLFVLRFRF